MTLSPHEIVVALRDLVADLMSQTTPPAARPVGGEVPTSTAPTLFFCTLPKSGTVFTWDSLVACTGLAMPNLSADAEDWQTYFTGHEYRHRTIYASGDFFTQRLRPDELKLWYPTGYVLGGHMMPSFHNIAALRAAGSKRITVLMRDPRDATVSWAHHIAKYGPEHLDYHSKIYPLPRDFFDRPFAEQVALHVRNFLPMAVTWVEAWLDWTARGAERGLDVQLVYFDALRSEPRAYIDSICRFHGFAHADLDKMPAAEAGKRHFRKGLHGDWCETFSPDDQAFANLAIGQRLADAFSQAASRDGDAQAGRVALHEGRVREAALLLLRAAEQFPGVPAIWADLDDACTRLGHPLPPVEAPGPEIDSHAAWFLVPQARLRAARAVASGF